MTLRDVQVLEVDGDKTSDAERKAMAAALLIPSFVVDPTGEVVEVRGTEALLGQIAELDPSIGTATAAPGFVATLEASVTSKYWNVSAGGWADWGSFEEAEEEGFYEGGDETEVDFTMHSVGTTDTGRGVLRRVEVLAGDELQDLLAETLAGFGAGVDTRRSTGSSPAWRASGRRPWRS